MCVCAGARLLCLKCFIGIAAFTQIIIIQSQRCVINIKILNSRFLRLCRTSKRCLRGLDHVISFILKAPGSDIRHLCGLVSGAGRSRWHRRPFHRALRPFLGVRRGRASGHLLFFLLMSTLQPLIRRIINRNQGFMLDN